MLDRDWIEAHIPHKFDMCLLEYVLEWDEHHIVCQTASHNRVNNPLRNTNQLGIAIAVEYAAQAMAIHGALLGGDDEVPQSGYLASVREVRWHADRLDDIKNDLTVRAERLSGNEVNVLYSFEIFSASELLISGRAAVMLNAAA